MKKFKGYTVHLEEFKGYVLGERVHLKADDDLPEAFGIVVCLKKAHAIVILDKKYREDKHDDGATEVDYSDIEKIQSTKKENKVSTKTKKQMKKSAKKSAKKESKKAIKKSANRPAAKRAKADGELTRKEAKEILKISVYAIDQALANKELKGLSKDQVLAYKKKLKE